MRGWFETVAALILGLATLGSAWSAYQSSLWRGIQNFRIADALAVGRRAGEKAIDANELRKVGAEVEEFADGLKITPRPLHGAEIETYNDHRMAMSMALIGLKVPGIVIRNPGCVAKTYPRFFEDLELLRDEKSTKDIKDIKDSRDIKERQQ